MSSDGLSAPCQVYSLHDWYWPRSASCCEPNFEPAVRFPKQDVSIHIFCCQVPTGFSCVAPHRQFGMRRSNKSYWLTSESCAHSRDFWRLYPVEEVLHPYPQGVFQRLVSHQHDRCQPTPDHWEKRFGSCSWRRRWPSSAGFSADFFGMSYCSPPSRA